MNSDQKPSIKLIEKRLVYSEPENKWVKVYFDLVQFPNGQTGRYNRILEGETGKGVAIIPIDADGKIGLISIYRYPISKWQWEIPRGFWEQEQTGTENSKRELLEETGYIAESLVKIGDFFPNSGILSTCIEVYCARQLTKQGGNIDPEEAISRVQFFSTEKITKMVCNGDITDGITLASFSLAKEKRIIK